jgi:outer membrane protein assembly factor BamB
VAFQGRVVCFDIAAGGRTVWSKDFSSSVGLSSDATQVYVPNEHDAISAYSLKNGGLAWRQDTLRNRKVTSPVSLPGSIAIGDFEGFVHFLAPTDGQLLARILVGGGAIQSPLVTTPQGVLVQSGDGLLVLIGLN